MSSSGLQHGNTRSRNGKRIFAMKMFADAFVNIVRLGTVNKLLGDVVRPTSRFLTF